MVFVLSFFTNLSLWSTSTLSVNVFTGPKRFEACTKLSKTDFEITSKFGTVVALYTAMIFKNASLNIGPNR